MKVELFVLCDAATDSFGKLNILGTFDTIGAADTPVRHPSCAVAVRLRFDRSEQGEHRIKISIVDADGQRVVRPLDAGAHVNIQGDHPSAATNLIVNFQQLEFKEYGDYSLDMAVDGELAASLPLFVRRRS